MANPNQPILKRIEKCAKDKKISLRALSLKAGAGPDLIRDWKGPKSPQPRLDSLKQVANVLGVSAGWLAFGEDAPAIRTHLVPIVSWVAAGRFMDTGVSDSASEAPHIQIGGLPDSQYLGLIVRGDSMNLVVPEGSIIIVDANDRNLLSRRHYIFQLNDEVTFKQYMTNPERLEPVSSNRDHEALPFTEETIPIGRVIRIIQEV